MAEDGQRDGRIWARVAREKAPPQRGFARDMRTAPTDAERKLWWHLRHRMNVKGSHFRRQVQIGPYIADFVSHGFKLVIEIDGGQHASETVKDNSRTQFLKTEGYAVLRFWNHDVLMNIDGVLTEIQSVIATTPTPDPSPQGGGEK